MIHGIDHTSLTVSDMERSIAFSRDIIGLKVIWDSAAEGKRIRNTFNRFTLLLSMR